MWEELTLCTMKTKQVTIKGTISQTTQIKRVIGLLQSCATFRNIYKSIRMQMVIIDKDKNSM